MIANVSEKFCAVHYNTLTFNIFATSKLIWRRTQLLWRNSAFYIKTSVYIYNLLYTRIHIKTVYFN